MLQLYCETCNKVICPVCTKEHNTHDYHLISECFPKHHQKIQANLDQLKHKKADLNTAVTQLDTTEKEVIEQVEQLQEQINTHARYMIVQVEKSREQLSQQLHNIVKQKTQSLAAQKQQAQRLNAQLNKCQEMIEHNLKEWTQLQILAEEGIMINQMHTSIQYVDPTEFQPIEKADIKFSKTDSTENKIGFIITSINEEATLNLLPSLADSEQLSTATLTLHSDSKPEPSSGRL